MRTLRSTFAEILKFPSMMLNVEGDISFSRSVLSELQSLHPEGDLGLFQPVGNLVAPLVFTEDEV